MTTIAAFASPVDAARWGEYRRPVALTASFAGRVTEPAAGRYHVYGGWFCPASHRLAIIRELAGLTDAVSMSYVDGLRDARGWAFREDTGPDPVNGFTLLAEAYLASDPGFGGAVSVPVLWDRAAGTILSNSPAGIGADLASAFRDVVAPPVELRPASLVPQLDAMSQRIATEIETQLGCAVYRPQTAERVRRALAGFDELLTTHRFLVADRLTDADIRLWVQLVRYDAGANAHKAIGPRLDSYPALWRWARDLYGRDAFRATTRFEQFSAPLADLPPW